MYSVKIRHILATLAATAPLVYPNMALAQGGTIGDINKPKSDVIIEPEKKPEVAKSAKIDTEQFELGFHFGVLNIEDFNSNLSQGLSFTWRPMDAVLTELRYTTTTVDRATFEDIAGFEFLSEENRKFTSTELLGGYRVLNGRSFFGSKTKIDSEIYLLGGLGQTSFAGDDSLSFTFGASYRSVLTDAITLNFDIRDHLFSRDFIGENKSTQNIEFSIGLNALF